MKSLLTFRSCICVALLACAPSINVKADIVGFGGNGAGWTVTIRNCFDNLDFPLIINSDVLAITDVTSYYSARSAFFKIPQPIRSFTASFTYQEMTARGAGGGPFGGLYNPADGIVFTLQNQGASAVGDCSARLGYGGITPAAGVALHVFSTPGYGGNVPGTGYAPATVPDSGNEQYLSTAPVDLLSGHPIHVTLRYDGAVLSEQLLDLTTGASFSTHYTVDLQAAVGGPTAFVGFTGSTGAGASDQRIKDFNFVTDNCVSLSFTPFYQCGASYDPPEPGVPEAFGPAAACNTCDVGCLLTSTASTISSFPGFENTTPETLNAMLVEVGAFDNDCRLAGLAKICQATGGQIAFQGLQIEPTKIDSYLTEAFCQRQDRVVLQLEHAALNLSTGKRDLATHYIMVLGKNGEDWSVFDPGWRAATPPEALSSLRGHTVGGFTTVKKVSSMQNQTVYQQVQHNFIVKGMRNFRRNTVPASCAGLEIIGHSPIEITAINSAGQRLGYEPSTGADLFEIPGGSYTRDFGEIDVNGLSAVVLDKSSVKALYIPGVSNGTYLLLLTGTGLGTFTVDFESIGGSGERFHQSMYGIVEQGLELRYSFEVTDSGSVVQLSKDVPTLSQLATEVRIARAIGLISSEGIVRSLTKKIDAALEALRKGNDNRMRGVLGAFVNEVRAQSGKSVSPEAAGLLIADARLITER